MKTIKKAVLLLLTAGIVFSFTSCSEGRTEKGEENLTSFDSVRDYSNRQGFRNWYYYCGDVESNDQTLMTYSDYYARYTSIYAGIYYDTYILREYWLLGEHGEGVVLAFEAPTTDTAEITVEFTLLSSNSAADVVLQLYSSEQNNGYGGDFHDSLIRKATEYGEENKLTETFKYETEEGELLYFGFYGSKPAYAQVRVSIEY